MTTDIGKRIRMLREDLGLTQRAFCNKVNIGQSTLAMFERGDRTPRDIHISMICNEFNVSEAWLETGKGEMYAFNSRDEEYAIATANLHVDNDERAKQVIINYWKLSPENKKAFWALLDEIMGTAKSEKPE